MLKIKKNRSIIFKKNRATLQNNNCSIKSESFNRNTSNNNASQNFVQNVNCNDNDIVIEYGTRSRKVEQVQKKY